MSTASLGQSPLLIIYLYTVTCNQIMPNDSLAGVSLKYGISLADLRRVNHLWASDSIHLRNVLYIPIDKSPRARELAQEMRLNAAPLVDLSTSTSSQSSDTAAETGEHSQSLDYLASVGFGIQRVPISRMSFFPPPSTSGKTPSISSTPAPSLSFSPKPPSQTRYSISPSLSSILTALPIAASARDGLLARLSFDSTSSSFSDRSRPSTELLEGHELDIVSNHAPKFSDNYQTGSIETNGSTPLSRPYILGTGYRELATTVKASTLKGLPRNNQHRHLSTTPPTAYIPQIPDSTTIRTVQMEPSPMMQLPTLRSRRSQQSTINGDPGRTNSGRESDAFELPGSNLINLG